MGKSLGKIFGGMKMKHKKYVSECCDAPPLGELSSNKLGFCSECKEAAVFILEEE